MLPLISAEMRVLVDQIVERIKDKVTIELKMEPEEMQIEGNASCIDEKTDAETCRWIRSQIESGNDWAWCATSVTATIGSYSGSDSLCGCSYHSEADFRTPGGYFSDMVSEATEACAYEIALSIETLRKLELIP